jgi:hypothetical protein
MGLGCLGFFFSRLLRCWPLGMAVLLVHIGKLPAIIRPVAKKSVPVPDFQSKLTISTQFAPLPAGYLPVGLMAPLEGSMA